MMTRTKAFALDVIGLCGTLPKGVTAGVIGRQLLRAGTSVGANYRSACHARSRADFVSKLGIVAEEADESLYWLELLVESRLCNSPAVTQLMNEAQELSAILVASAYTARTRIGQMPNPKSEIRNPK